MKKHGHGNKILQYFHDYRYEPSGDGGMHSNSIDVGAGPRSTVLSFALKCGESDSRGDDEGGGELAANSASSMIRAAMVGYLLALSEFADNAAADEDGVCADSSANDDGGISGWLILAPAPSRHSHIRPRYRRWCARAHCALQNTSVLAHVTHAAADAGADERAVSVLAWRVLREEGEESVAASAD
jgi:hypothetical protein